MNNQSAAKNCKILCHFTIWNISNTNSRANRTEKKSQTFTVKSHRSLPNLLQQGSKEDLQNGRLQEILRRQSFGTTENRKQLHDSICQELIQVENFYDIYRWGQIDEEELQQRKAHLDAIIKLQWTLLDKGTTGENDQS